MRAESRVIKARTGEAMKSCKWTYDWYDDSWDTQCDNKFSLIDGTPYENKMRFCCYCGGKLDQRCRKCGGGMKPSKAIEQTYTSGMPDFHGDDVGITISPGGPGKLVDCLKCEKCGWSVT